MRSKPLERSKTEADGDGIGFVPKSIGSGEQIREKYNGNCSKTVVFCQIFFRFLGSGAKPERTNSPQRIPPGYGSVFAVDFRSMRCAHSLGDSGSAAIRALCPELGGRAGVDPDGSVASGSRRQLTFCQFVVPKRKPVALSGATGR